jgi:hypothetical protein
LASQVVNTLPKFADKTTFNPTYQFEATDQPGTFIAILNYDNEAVFSAVIAPGNNP